MMRKKHFIYWLGIIIFILFFSQCGLAEQQAPASIYIEIADDYGKITDNGLLPDYSILNNVWNKVHAAPGPYEEKIFLKNDNGQVTFGWKWQWPMSKDVVAYPEIIYGIKPWDMGRNSYTAEGILPFIAGTKNVTANFNIHFQNSGVCDMAFSFWAVSDLKTPLSHITNEIMIWNISNGGWAPAGKPQGTIKVNGITYDYYQCDQTDQSGYYKNHWILSMFASRQPVLNGPLDLSNFVDYLLKIHVLSRKHYITSVELGNEIVGGTGSAEISDYSIDIK
jgi:Glycosyl hydrolase family 12.